MGVPKFYRWISERYPCLSEVVREYQIPEFDNLYLDMNGIIHNCSHPNDDDVHFRLSEEQVFLDIFRYIEFLFRMIKPRKVFFMAIDGVAPRAKMNQQRGRRFRSAKEAEKLENEAKKRGEVLPKEARFDSNCITPGTDFMDRLHKALQLFVVRKISEDDMWRGVRVILSGHETPGEGEHKVMDFLRSERSKPEYDPNTRHCLYGLDADLIVLGLSSHEPHFSLLREEVKFLKSKKDSSKKVSRSVNPDVITFHLLHLSLLRNYLDHEFSRLKSTLTNFEYNIESIVDDWLLMGFLVGNDFIPHIPHFHINKNSLVLLYQVYMDVLPTLDGYLNEQGTLNLRRFEIFLQKVAEIDEENFLETFADLRYSESKTASSKSTSKVFQKFYSGEEAKDASHVIAASNGRFTLLEGEDDGIQTVSPLASDDDADAAFEEQMDKSSTSSDDSCTFDEEFRLHKQHYYETKLELKSVDEAALRDQAYGYIRALQWNLHYYYDGCVSWSWFYPHHYAPYISDVKNFQDVELNFEIGKPFKPFEQLLAVLPAASKDLLPHAFQRLLTDPNSPLIHNYPKNFELDMNEKQQDWEAVVKINFIDEKELLKAAQECSILFSAKEKERNIHGPHLEFTWTPEQQDEFKSPLTFLRSVDVNHAIVRPIHMDQFRIQRHQIKKGLLPGAKLDTFYPGFPTLFFVDHTAKLSREKVKVFEMPSQNENMILTIKDLEVPANAQPLATQLLSKPIFIQWPHLLEAKVIKVCETTHYYELDQEGRVAKVKMPDADAREIVDHVLGVTRHFKERLGINIGTTDIVLICLPMTGRKYVSTSDGIATLEKEWSSVPVYAPYQTVVKDLSTYDPNFQQFKTLDELFPVETKCFVLAPSYYGQPAVVIQTPVKSTVRVKITSTQEPDLSEVIMKEAEVLADEYHQNYVMAQRLGISGHVLSRLTGTVFVSNGNAKVNIGLQLRFNQRNEEVPGFSKKIDDTWYMSRKVGDIVAEYLEKFPRVVENLTNSMAKDVFTVNDLFPGEEGRKSLQDLISWSKTLPTHRATRQKIGAEILDECVVKYIEKLLSTHWMVEEEKPKEMILDLKPNFLFRPLHFMGYSKPDPNAKFNLYDRVVNVRNGISVPLGLKGVVIGKHVDPVVEVNTVYDVLFDEEFPGGVALRCSHGRGYKMSAANMINLTYGASLVPNKARQMKGVVKHAALQADRTSQPNRTPQKQTPRAQERGGGFVGVDDRRNGHHTQLFKKQAASSTPQQGRNGPIQILQRNQPKQKIALSPKKVSSSPIMLTSQEVEEMPPPPVRPKGLVMRKISPGDLLGQGERKQPKGIPVVGHGQGLSENGVTPKRKSGPQKVDVNDILANAHQKVHVATPRPTTQKKKDTPSNSGVIIVPAGVKDTGKKPGLNFVPTQVSRTSSAKKKTPQAKKAAVVEKQEKIKTPASQKMLHVEDLEKGLEAMSLPKTPTASRTTARSVSVSEIFASSAGGSVATSDSAAAINNNSPACGKKRLAINL